MCIVLSFHALTLPLLADIFFGGSMYAAEVTPVVHYTMGGIEIDSSGRALAAGPSGAVLGGLYAAGEASGG